MSTEHYIISTDRTRIGYRQYGSGAGLIIVHGAGRISQNYHNLAAALAAHYTVYTYDRRGRGLSGPVTSDHSIQKEGEDLLELINVTKAVYIFGHSFGGLVALQAEMTSLKTRIKKISVYDPAVSIEGSIPTDWLPGFEKAMFENRKEKAMVLLLKGLKTPVISGCPKWMLLGLVRLIKFLERKKDAGVRMLDLLHTIPADIKIVRDTEASSPPYQNIDKPVLLLSGTNGQAFFHETVRSLAGMLPHSQSKILKDFDHYSPEEKVAELSSLLHTFFQDKNNPH